MSIRFQCACGQTLEVAEQFAGKQARCPKCAALLRIPLQTVAIQQELPAVPRRRSAPPPLPEEVVSGETEELDEDATASPASRKVTRPRRVEEDEEDTPQYDEKANNGRQRQRTRADADLEEEAPLINHAGNPLDEDADLFEPPPREIGQILTAYTSLRRDKRPLSEGARLGIILGTVAVCVVLGLLLGVAARNVGVGLLLTCGLGLVGFLVSWWLTGFRHVCHYVGKKGVAMFWCRGRRRNVTERLFLFRDAAELRIAQTRHYYNGVYTNTSYAFTWTDEGNNKVFSLHGTYRSEAGTPKDTSEYWLAHSAEIAWSNYLLDHMDDLANKKGAFFFALKGNDGVEVGEGYIKLHQKRDTVHLDADDIAEVQINQGMFCIREHGAKEGWFSSTGIHRFPYHDLANAQFFLLALNKLTGVRIVG